ncbi:efflux RND transporter permease subunit [Anaeromyxobacter oryzae]|uniref:Transporter n=1 Tax=Anaeromyxobacter oryzae TaxID=2918170 RepID=A0ABN6MK98_9BACT|nr:MMPL family transporter [Anaeromyxobacter oryzae]BDG01286.1 transporter [Anaeromyxobacter oryzae]
MDGGGQPEARAMRHEGGQVARVYARLVARPAPFAAAALALTAVLGVAAARVRPDFSLEQLFPIWDRQRAEYDRFKARFPGEDARAVVIVEADDLFTPAGVARLAALEADVGRVKGVTRVVGPASVEHGVRTPFGPARERLLSPELPAGELRLRAAAAREDRLLAWNVFAPDGRSVAILADLDRATAGSDAGRQTFVRAAQAVLGRHARPGQALTLSGLPAVRARIAALVNEDVSRLVPLAIGAVLLLLVLAFRSAAAAAGGLAAILAALVWSYGVLGLLGWPLGALMGMMPVVVVIVSVADSVHILSELHAELRAGAAPAGALAGAMTRTVVPCLVTELVLGAGFLTLVAVRMTAVIQFAVITAIAMPLAWLANALVLPLVLRGTVRRAPAVRAPPWALGRAAAATAWMERQAFSHPRRVVAGAALVLAAAGLLATRVRIEYRVFDDLRPGSEVAREIARAEAAIGGIVPIAIHVEADAPGGALDPAAVRLADRAAAFLRSFPEIRQANALGDFVRPAYALVAGEGDGDGLPASPEAMAQVLEALGDRRVTLDVLSPDRRALAAVGRVLDVGVARTDAIVEAVEAWVAAERVRLAADPGAPRLRLAATGQLVLFQDVSQQLLGGLAASFGAAILLSLVLMSVALRSWRLGLVGLVPNASPVLLVLAFMGATGIPLSPVTVMAFSITLVIADDDTIQLLTRFREHHATAAAHLPPAEAHRAATHAALGEVGVPMLVSGAAVSAGFGLLLLSGFLGPARLGALIAATLGAAVFADLFLTPLLLVHLRPLATRERRTSSLSPRVSGGRGPG